MTSERTGTHHLWRREQSVLVIEIHEPVDSAYTVDQVSAHMLGHWILDTTSPPEQVCFHFSGLCDEDDIWSRATALHHAPANCFTDSEMSYLELDRSWQWHFSSSSVQERVCCQQKKYDGHYKTHSPSYQMEPIFISWVLPHLSVIPKVAPSYREQPVWRLCPSLCSSLLRFF